MFGFSESAIILIALAAAAALLMWGAFSSLPRVSRTVARSFWCPFHHGDVTAEFQEDAWDGKPVEVVRCTAFTPPTAITCTKLCRFLRRFPSLRKAKVLA